MDSPERSTETEKPSCHGCRRRKQKCSREEPACAHCQRLGAPCVYGAKKTKPGPKAGNAEKWSRRVGMCLPTPPYQAGNLINILAEALEDLVHDTNNRNGGPSNDTRIIPPIAEALARLTAEIGNLASKIGSLENLKTPIPASPEEFCHDKMRAPDHKSPTSEPVRKRRGYERVETGSHAIGHHGQRDVVVQLKAGHLPFNLVEECVTLFFSGVYWWIPILHLGRFKIAIQHWPRQKDLKVVTYAIVVASLRFLDCERFKFSASEVEEIISSLRDYILLAAMNSLSVENLQALSILAFMDIGDGNTVRACSIVGLITRAVEHMQLTMEDEDIRRENPLTNFTSPISPAYDWTEAEGKRRIFWNAFNLDSCKPSFKVEDISRRLPADGTFWYSETRVLTPYFLINDMSSEIQKSPTAPSQSRYQSRGNQFPRSDRERHLFFPASAQNEIEASVPVDSSNMGGLAYFIEATETLYQVQDSLLYQRVSFNDKQDFIRYLTRFKELDLKLVRWKMTLPKRWRDPNHAPDTSTCSKTLDYNMTLAHITHNTSMIILHQRIAYPPSDWQNIVPLPSSCSAETCLMAAIETSNIASRCLEICHEYMILAPQFAFCVYMSARVLLVHWRHDNRPLVAEFFNLINSLQNMARRWVGVSSKKSPDTCQAGKYAIQLQMLHSKYQMDPTFNINVVNDSKDELPAENYLKRKNRDREDLAQSDFPPQISKNPTPPLKTTLLSLRP
ncbi:hypothetical protein N7493_000942 [Penicillium malachiteum]|uniref:Zn(2)-C6 fungal-type domain-containing protein n=1 Tax=Penicillium malachiteum TaxID=1324776 RepID=A0AAD6N1W2_9EURO|nr:hypothetical protein N7493_000942 [Penicillium malachiteum]